MFANGSIPAKDENISNIIGARELAQRLFTVRVRSLDRNRGTATLYSVDLQASTALGTRMYGHSLATVALHDFQFDPATSSGLDVLAPANRPRAIYLHAGFSMPNNIQTAKFVSTLDVRKKPCQSSILHKIPVKSSGEYFLEGAPMSHITINPFSNIEFSLRDHNNILLDQLPGAAGLDFEHEFTLQVQFLE